MVFAGVAGLADKRNYYLGIDLGTTNSVLAWGVVNPQTQRIEPSVLPILMQVPGGMQKRELLPSCVYFKEGSGPIIGEYAKAMLGRQSQRVVRSSKSYMGRHDKSWAFDGVTYWPEDIAALILRYLRSACKDYFGFEPDDVVITVPASFDTDMRSATVRAAENAGFRTTEEDGSPRNILLDEPRASLYDFINLQERGLIPDALIDFREPKNILVYDLGGGTLDISLHKVQREPTGISIEDYAISRYSRIGGDDFDRLTAAHLMSIFARNVSLDDLDELQRKQVEATFLELAETAKIELTQNIENALRWRRESTNLENITVEIVRTNIVDDRGFEYVMSKAEFDEVWEPLLGNNLSLSDLARFKELQPKNEDMIYPVLDVLNKAANKLGSVPKIDAVLLNGGMTRVHAVQERLERLFGDVILLKTGDPDKSVARGAVIHHYNLHRGIRPAVILNETIGLATVGGFVRPLAQAGVVLPFETIIDDFVIPRDGTTVVELPFYRGSGSTIDPPNVKIATRRLVADRPLRSGEGMAVRIAIDERNIMVVEGWLEKEPGKKARFEIVLDGGSDVQGPVVDPVPPGDPAEDGDSPPPLDVQSSSKHLLKLLKQYVRELDQYRQAVIMKEIKAVESSILKAGNAREFVDPLIRAAEGVSRGNSFALGRLIITLGNLAQKYPHDETAIRVCEFCIRTCEWAKSVPGLVNTVVRYAVEAVGKCGLSRGEIYLKNLLYAPEARPVRHSVLVSLGKIGRSRDAVANVVRFFSGLESESVRMSAYWAVGRLGSREKKEPIAIKEFETVIPRLCKALSVETHPMSKMIILYALSEIGDRRSGDPNRVISDKQANDLLAVLRGFLQIETGKALRGLIDKDQLEKEREAVELAVSMIEGRNLTKEQESTLVGLRSQLSEAS